MLRYLMPFVLILGTSCSLNRQFVYAVDNAWGVIGPRYEEYVRKDESLDEETRAIRLRTSQLMTEVIEEAKK